MGFKSEHTFEHRSAESKRILTKYPDLIPLICERSGGGGGGGDDVPVIDKKKYLVPPDLTMGQFMYVIRKRMKLPSEKALFLLTNGKMSNSSCLVSHVYHENKDTDGFLYVCYSGENTFG